MQRKIRKAVIPVAGDGTRMLPATKSVPKELLTVYDRPVIQYVVDEALAAGIEQIVFVTGRGKSAIEDHFGSRPELESSLTAKSKHRELALAKSATLREGVACFTRQLHPAGLGHAILCAQAFIGDECFAVLLPDVISGGDPVAALHQLTSAHATVGGNLVATERIPTSETHKYGIVDVGGSTSRLCSIRDMVEKPSPAAAPSNLMIMGRYILEPGIFNILTQGTPGAGGEIQLTDAMRTLALTRPFHALEMNSKSYDCGSPLGLLSANVALALARSDVPEDVREVLRNALHSEGARCPRDARPSDGGSMSEIRLGKVA